MTDTREALVARQREEYGESWDVLVPEVGWTLGRIIESVIEDVLAAGWTPPTVKPSVEDVARAIDPAIYPHINHLTGDAWAASKRAATAVLALLPGRSEAEVKAEALREAAETLRAEDMGHDRWYADGLEHRADRIVRLARGEGS